jgi:uncharacterized membrane protein
MLVVAAVRSILFIFFERGKRFALIHSLRSSLRQEFGKTHTQNTKPILPKSSAWKMVVGMMLLLLKVRAFLSFQSFQVAS